MTDHDRPVTAHKVGQRVVLRGIDGEEIVRLYPADAERQRELLAAAAAERDDIEVRLR